MQSSCPGPETGLESLPQPSKPAEPRVVHKLPEWFRVSTVTGKDYKDDIVSPTTLKSPDKEKKEEEAEDEDTTYLRNYYARYGQTITQEAAQAEEQPAMVLAQPVPGHPAVAAAAAFLGGASPAPMVAHLDDDDDDEEFVEVDIGYENGAVGDKRKRLAEDVGG